MTPIEQVRAKCQQIVEAGERLYQVNLKKVIISFDLKGRAAGWAQLKHGVFKVKFNHDMITRGDPEVLRDMIDDTVPHEYAHIVCYMRPSLGRNHDSGWRRVCIGLGGAGSRQHDHDVVYGKGTTYEYTTDRGHKVRMNDRHHARIQSGTTLRYRKGMGNVSMTCAYSIVGQQGRTLANPIVRQAANHPAVIEAAVRAASQEPSREEMARRAAMVEALRRQQLMTKLVKQVIPVPTPVVVVRPAAAGESKAATSRRIMLAGYRGGQSYEVIIAAMMAANGYDRQLARATFRANVSKVGIPNTFGG